MDDAAIGRRVRDYETMRRNLRAAGQWVIDHADTLVPPCDLAYNFPDSGENGGVTLMLRADRSMFSVEERVRFMGGDAVDRRLGPDR